MATRYFQVPPARRGHNWHGQYDALVRVRIAVGSLNWSALHGARLEERLDVESRIYDAR